jgi:hypothetical protein
LKIEIIYRSFVVSVQPDMVLKKGVRNGFTVSVKLLIGDRLGMLQHLINRPVVMRLCAEEQARELRSGQIGVCDMYVFDTQIIRITIGMCCSIDTGTFTNKHAYFKYENECLCATFNLSCLTELERRNKTADVADENRATEKKYAMLFSVEPFHLANVGQIDLIVCGCRTIFSALR